MKKKLIIIPILLILSLIIMFGIKQINSKNTKLATEAITYQEEYDQENEYKEEVEKLKRRKRNRWKYSNV